ncbi:MAG: cell division protein FtsQ/DivIB [Oleispira antarctica]|nr:cell division protein FtsQ/DivIB [Oleispira antarctica]MBQ0792645.1 cell division protein FtsQ/DivIB [Oleispira antarctica]
MLISSMKDHATKSHKDKRKQRSPQHSSSAKAIANKGATRLKKKTPFSFARVAAVIPMWFVQSVFVVSLLVLSGWGLQQVRWGWPVEQVEIEGEFRFWQAEELAKQLLWVKEQNFFSLDVRQVKTDIEQLPLIKSAQVKKVWPDTLLVKFKEDIPVAVWNQKTLLNPQGEELILSNSFDATRLPRLFGPKKKTEQVMRQFQRFQSRLLSVDAAMVSLTMNTVGSWQIELANGWMIRLGRQQLEQRLERLIELLKILPQEKVAVVDLRYGKGAAIKWLSV